MTACPPAARLSAKQLTGADRAWGGPVHSRDGPASAATMGKHENRVVGRALLIQITFAALILLVGYLARG